MGFYSGLEDTQANLHYTDYVWYEIKGPKGDGVSYTVLSSTVGLTKTYTMYTADGTAVGSFTVTDGEGAVSTVDGIAPDGDGDVPITINSVADLEISGTPLVVGSATIANVYSALADKQVYIGPATDFATGELPLVGGNRQNDGTIEIVKGDGTDGWIEFHGRLSSVGDFRMFFNSSDVPTGTWLQMEKRTLLWSNDSAVAGGTPITLSSGDYDFLECVFVQSTATDAPTYTVRTMKGRDIALDSISISPNSTSDTFILRRILNYNSATSYTAETCNIARFNGGFNDYSNLNIPIRIWGIKGISM